MEVLFLVIIIGLLAANLYFVTKKDAPEDEKNDEYLIKGIVSEIIEKTELCPICREEDIPLEKTVETNCNHRFCKSCLDKYRSIDEECKCPLCRTEIKHS